MNLPECVVIAAAKHRRSRNLPPTQSLIERAEAENKLIDLECERKRTVIDELEHAFFLFFDTYCFFKMLPEHIEIERTRRTVRGARIEDIKKKQVERVVCTVSSAYDVPPSKLCSGSKQGIIPLARMVAMFLLKSDLSLSNRQAASCVGLKHHTTALHAFRKIGTRMVHESDLAETIAMIRKDSGHLTPIAAA